MESLDVDALDAAGEEFDAAVLACPDIDHFCSASVWILPAHQALMPPRSPWLRRGEEGWVTLARGSEGPWRYLQPLEAMWGLASPLVGSVGLVRELAAALRQDRGWNLLLLSGLKPDSALFVALVEHLGKRCEIGMGQVTQRFVASLEGGMDGFLGRRSANFRHALKKALRRAAEMGIEFETVRAGDGEAALGAYARVLAIEARSWKGREGVGVEVPEMREFYRRMLPRLAARGAMRLGLARHEGRDVGYILGGVLGDTYRGLQFSFDEAYAAASLGNVMQYHQIEALVEEGIGRYDLGADMEYKRRWAEPGLETVMLVGRRII